MVNENEITCRETNIDDLDILVKMRVDFIIDWKSCDDVNKLEEIQNKTRQYLEELIINNEYIGFIGLRGKEHVCCAGLLIYRLPPLINAINRVQGHVLNVFTYPEYRHLGYGKRMMEFVVQKARENNINRLFLNSTIAGEGLYKKIGFFEPKEKAMILNID